MHIKIRFFLNLWLGLTRYRRTSTYTMLHYREWYHMAKENPSGLVAYCVYMRVQLAWMCLDGLVGLSWKHAFSNSALDIWSFHECDILNTYAHLWSTQVIMLEASHSMMTFGKHLILKLSREFMANYAAAFTFNGWIEKKEKKNACLSNESLLRISSLEDNKAQQKHHHYIHDNS